MDVPRRIARSRFILGSDGRRDRGGISGCNTFALEPSDFWPSKETWDKNVSVQPLVRFATYTFAAAERRKHGYVVRRVLFRSGSAAARCWFHRRRSILHPPPQRRAHPPRVPAETVAP